MTEEFGASYEGAVEVLLAEGTVPASVYFDAGSGTAGRQVSQWSVYDGRPGIPRAAALRAVCSCGWTGSEQRLDCEAIGGRDFAEAGDGQADACERAWDAHTANVEASTIPLPDTITMLLEQLEEEIDKLAKTSPIAAVRAARRTAIAAERVGYWAARSTLHDLTNPRQSGRRARPYRECGTQRTGTSGPLPPLRRCSACPLRRRRVNSQCLNGWE
ncbi:hypothetical protein ACFV2B_23165 [Streptomyces lavendulae]|uniref:hypothetical protein n=1 Tax=Streptomyces lavendulae TaxID=1914 RepID=UPI00368184DA